MDTPKKKHPKHDAKRHGIQHGGPGSKGSFRLHRDNSPLAGRGTRVNSQASGEVQEWKRTDTARKCSPREAKYPTPVFGDLCRRSYKDEQPPFFLVHRKSLSKRGPFYIRGSTCPQLFPNRLAFFINGLDLEGCRPRPFSMERNTSTSRGGAQWNGFADEDQRPIVTIVILVTMCHQYACRFLHTISCL